MSCLVSGTRCRTVFYWQVRLKSDRSAYSQMRTNVILQFQILPLRFGNAICICGLTVPDDTAPSSEDVRKVKQTMASISKFCTERLSHTRFASSISKADLEAVRTAFKTKLHVKDADNDHFCGGQRTMAIALESLLRVTLTTHSCRLDD